MEQEPCLFQEGVGTLACSTLCGGRVSKAAGTLSTQGRDTMILQGFGFLGLSFLSVTLDLR